MTPLAHAVISKRMDAVKVLLVHNRVDPDVRDNFGRTILSQVIVASDYFQDPYPSSSLEGAREEISAVLLRSDVNVNAQDMYGTTPLSFAAQSGRLAIAKMILDVDDASVDINDQDGRAPLSYAVQYGHADIVQLLLGRNGTDHVGPLLVYAALNKHLGIMEVLLRQNNVAINYQKVDDVPFLHFVARLWLVDVYDLILDVCGESVDVNVKDSEGKTLFSHAVQYCYNHMVHRLLDRKDIQADIKDNRGWTPLFYAMTNKDITHIKAYRNSADMEPRTVPVVDPFPFGDPWQTLIPPQSSIDLHLEIVRLLLGRSDVSPNVVDEAGHTPIYYAIQHNDIDVVNVFLEQGIVDTNTLISIAIPDFIGGDGDVNLKDGDGRTLFSYAAERGSPAVDLLLQCADLDINSQDKKGRTPLSYAAENGRMRIVKSILKRKDVDVNLSDSNGVTPLGYTERAEALGVWMHDIPSRIAHMLRMYGCADSTEVRTPDDIPSSS
ncbi:ankyrin repeat-containing domain protein [Desarmillaria tabescens]|uniref:Ankyrin repeat-containing domain protein n=1 Tax=Armillaria tabescens TaxID=1929756 RepID=A0AA39NJD6_ARMTA|nr:ankyrin repeat-containing domain protein [Desarmillaria tabescens]KAK0466743.1 ankyrin repeat-containing domain protein [Desarmillaria tabescens]